MDNRQDSHNTFALMQAGTPLATFKKTHLGQLSVDVINLFDDKPMNIVLKGIPAKNEEDSFVEIWSEKALMFFLRSPRNRKHIASGALIEWVAPRNTNIQKTANNMSEEELAELVVAPFLKLKKTVETMTTEAALLRVVTAAEIANRPEKTMLFLRGKLSLLQSGEMSTALGE